VIKFVSDLRQVDGSTNALLLLVSHVMGESFKSLGKTQPFTVSLATNALLLLVSLKIKC
jgi:hypothetical protein